MIDAPTVDTLTLAEQQSLDAYTSRLRKMATEDVGAELLGLKECTRQNTLWLTQEWEQPGTYDLLQAQMVSWQQQIDSCENEMSRRRAKDLLPLGKALTAITPEVIHDVKTRIDLCDLIERSGVELKKRGKSYLGLCPFHPDHKTPNFHVYPEGDDAHFHCFSCGAHGDAFTFLMRRENLDFIAALKDLAASASIELPRVYQNGNGHAKGSNGNHNRKLATRPQVRRDFLSTDYLAALAQLGYTFRLNELDDSIEVCNKPLTDPVRSVIRTQIRDAGFKGMDALEDAYVANAYANRYHPIQDYLNGLVWDQKPNIATLAKHFDNPDGAFPVWLRRWLIGAVAKVFTAAQNRLLVLDGPQGIGKSKFARWICPLADYFIESPINPDDKDSLLRLMNRWVWEVSELGATVRRADREALKAFISQQSVTVRKSYGRQDTIKPALASLIGTVNNESGILSDPTGSRRFLVCRIDKINWAYRALDVSQVWAEAYAAYRQGEDWNLSALETSRANEINSLYEVDDPIAAMIAEYFVLDPKSEEWTSALKIQTILQDAGLRGTTRGNSMAIASAMRTMGFDGSRQYEKGVQMRGYKGVRPR